ncbi:hypothetical protein [Yeosuana marina]|uniref:hypothetical protein n=2 Tax=Yeosuana marina TaxID=1565536 RepID=UPI0030EE172E|tara:strand:+ start:2000 stop:2521 length:522 start_codon:yes stop_codon:yes gene_type:complete
MNYIKHLNGVLERFSKDNRLNPSHISLYMALFQIWNNYHFKPGFYINRAEVMDLSKLGSKTTYHRCIKELSDWSYLFYSPSHNPFRGSQIKMFIFGTSDELPIDLSRTKIGTTNGQALVSKDKPIKTGINNTNLSKQKNNKKKIFEKGSKQNGTVPYQDNLKTSSDKNYNEPL